LPTPTRARSAVLEEKVATYYESGNDAHNWRFPAGLERGDLVFRSATTGASFTSTTCRPAPARTDHGGRGQRHASAQRRREESDWCTFAASARKRGAIPISSTSIASARWQEPDAAHT
jgi:hypothetical protein